MNTLKIEFSLTPIKLLIILLALGPWYGIYNSYIFNLTYIGLEADLKLLINFSIYTLIIIIVIASIRSKIEINYHLLEKKQLTRHLNRLVFVAFFAFIVVYLFAGQYIFSGNMDRGEVRIHAGLLGPLYSFTLKYLLPLLSFVSLIYLFQIKAINNKGFNQKKLYIVIGFILLTALSTGAKATLIFISLPLICYYWAQSSSLSKVILTLGAVSFMVFSHVLLGGDNISILKAFDYILARSTYVAAYGVLGSWDFANTVDYELFPLILNSLFGNHISSLMIDSSNGQLFGDTGKLVTYAYYPNYERAMAGTVNLTLTLFGDLYIYFHTYWIIGLLFFMLIMRYIFAKMISALKRGRINTGIILFIYLNMVILPVINSGGPLQPISFPIIIYFIIVFYVLIFLLPKNKAISDV